MLLRFLSRNAEEAFGIGAGHDALNDPIGGGGGEDGMGSPIRAANPVSTLDSVGEIWGSIEPNGDIGRAR